MTDAESSTKGNVESKGEEKGGLLESVLEQWQVLVKIVELVSKKKLHDRGSNLQPQIFEADALPLRYLKHQPENQEVAG